MMAPMPTHLERDENPLLIALPKEMNREELSIWLEQGPTGLAPSSSMASVWFENILVVTRESLEIARAMLMVMRQAAHLQDPRELANRNRANSASEILRAPLPLNGTAPTARGFCLFGITGVGKSHIVKHVLSRIRQVIDHERNEQCELLALRQLVHLTVHLSGDGTPVAFFTSALSEMDSKLGTNYLQQIIRQKPSAQSLLVFFMTKVVVHRVLFIAIEEAQDSNLNLAAHASMFKAMFLRLMNFCIPVGLIGNPKGIEPLFAMSQIKRRMTSAGLFRIEPAFRSTDELWFEDYMPGIWGLSPLAAEDEAWCSPEDLSEILWTRTGGFPGHLALLRAETIREAMDRGSPRVEQLDIDTAFASPIYAGAIELAERFAKRDHRRLKSFSDIDHSYYARIWAFLNEEDVKTRSSNTESSPAPLSPGTTAAPEETTAGLANPEPSGTQRPNESKKAPAAKQRRSSRSTRNKAPKPDISPDDVRSETWRTKQSGELDA